MNQTVFVTLPRLHARNLEGSEIVVPDDFAGDYTVAIFAFQRWHQSLVNSWMSWLEPLMERRPDVRAYELPMLSSIYTLARPFIDGRMAAIITNKAVRERTLTVYTDLQRTMTELQIPTTETIVPMLVDRSGHILWRGKGGYDASQAAELISAIGG